MRQQPRIPLSASQLIPPPFRCAVASAGVGAVRVDVAGELDIATAPVLRDVLRDAQASARLVVLDLHALTFTDTAGLHVLEDRSLEALTSGKRLVLARVPAHARRVIELCGLAPALEVLEGESIRESTGRQVYMHSPAEART